MSVEAKAAGGGGWANALSADAFPVSSRVAGMSESKTMAAVSQTHADQERAQQQQQQQQ